MQKDYRDFTVEELMDMGFDVEVKKHGVESVEEAKEMTRMFEGTKQSSHDLEYDSDKVQIVKAWRSKFHVNVYV